MRANIASFASRVAKPADTALDFGCGTQPYRSLFERAGCRYRGADFDEAADIAIRSDGRLAMQTASADLVLSFQVLEHVRDLDLYFGEARRVLRNDGWMILSTHGNWLYHPHPEDHRRWTREGLIAEISAHGFEVVECAAVVGPLAWTTMLRLTCAAYALNRLQFAGKAFVAALALLMNARAWLEDWITPQWVTRDNACVYVTLCRPHAGTARKTTD
ncbi:MAG TPA: methyltransferase domain-containing protein [Micropepsaceae bacterium]|nr:methyltransferase domain-containing protein [Micropepsaceae bacterium]